MAHVSHTRRRHLVPVTTNRSRVLLPQPPVFDSWSKPCQTPPLIGACSTSTVTDAPGVLWRLAEYLGVQPEVAMALGADLDIDPALLAHALPGSPYDAPDSNNPPSPIDINMIDPELLALYPAPDPSPPLAAAAVLRPVPPDDANHSADTAACVDAVCTGAAPSPPPGSANVSCSAAADKKHAASGRKRRPPSVFAVGKAKRTRSDGVLVPPTPCARCVDIGRRDECRVVYEGAACNKCRQRGRKRTPNGPTHSDPLPSRAAEVTLYSR